MNLYLVSIAFLEDAGIQVDVVGPNEIKYGHNY